MLSKVIVGAVLLVVLAVIVPEGKLREQRSEWDKSISRWEIICSSTRLLFLFLDCSLVGL